MRQPTSNVTSALFVCACCLGVSGCDYDVPITPEPTRQIDSRLMGNWVSAAGKDRMKVRRLDDAHYIVSFNGDLFYAHHSDVAGTAFVSAQELDSGDRRYLFLAYTMSGDGAQLGLRSVNTEAIAKETKNSADVRRLLEKNLANPALFDEEILFAKEK